MISHIESGRSRLPAEHIFSLAEELQINPFDLVEILVSEFRESIIQTMSKEDEDSL